MSIYSKDFWKETAERAAKTMAQSMAGFLVADLAIWDLGWATATGVSLTITLASILTSIASSGIGPTGTPSVVSKAPTNSIE